MPKATQLVCGRTRTWTQAVWLRAHWLRHSQWSPGVWERLDWGAVASINGRSCCYTVPWQAAGSLMTRSQRFCYRLESPKTRSNSWICLAQVERLQGTEEPNVFKSAIGTCKWASQQRLGWTKFISVDITRTFLSSLEKAARSLQSSKTQSFRAHMGSPIQRWTKMSSTLEERR